MSIDRLSYSSRSRRQQISAICRCYKRRICLGDAARVSVRKISGCCDVALSFNGRGRLETRISPRPRFNQKAVSLEPSSGRLSEAALLSVRWRWRITTIELWCVFGGSKPRGCAGPKRVGPTPSTLWCGERRRRSALVQASARRGPYVIQYVGEEVVSLLCPVVHSRGGPIPWDLWRRE